MNSNKINKAVITGDIIGSTRIRDKGDFINSLKTIFSEIESNILGYKCFEIFRGDGFQGIIENPKDSLLVAILIRTGLRSKTNQTDYQYMFPGKLKDILPVPLELLWDARISIGIGQVNYRADNVFESSGEAFELSGKRLDQMKKLGERLAIITHNTEFNENILLLNHLLDAVMEKWSNFASEAVYLHLLNNDTQKQIAKYLNISQPAVQKRLSSANIEVIESFIKSVNKSIKELDY